MPESETVLVFRILGVLAKCRDLDHGLAVEAIAGEAHLGRAQTEYFMRVLERAGAIRADGHSTVEPGYRLTRYGSERLGHAVG